MASSEAKITLHWLDQSRSQRIVWLLEELQVPYEVKLYHRDKKTFLAPASLEKVHPLGKSPVVTVKPAGDASGDASDDAAAGEIVLAESAFIAEYLCDHFGGRGGRKLVPERWRPGREGQVGGEAEEWLRYRYLMHYAEGSLMPPLVIALILGRLKGPDVPFVIRPISAAIANRVSAGFVFPNLKKHLDMLEGMLASSGGDYLCGGALTAADVLMSFPLMAGRARFDEVGRWPAGSAAETYPGVWAYMVRLEGTDGYKRSVDRIREVEREGGEGAVKAKQ